MRCRSRLRLSAGLLAQVAASLLVLSPSLARAGVPAQLTEQGRLFDSGGNPLDSEVTLTFSIYAAAQGGSALWSEAQAVTLDQGYFSVQLGSTSPIPQALWSGATLYVGVAVGADPEMSPRQSTSSVPYALVSNDVVGDIHPTSVSVSGSIVINSSGQWVGPTTNLVGPTGAQGPAGAQGPGGSQGAAGPQGPVGAQGLAGAQGPAGPQGMTGAQGADGPSGATGPAGAQGADGPSGATGPAGAQGADGPSGATGAAGAQGPAGAQGTIGAQGATGSQGPAGPAGATGAAGAQGPAGPSGAPGVTGPQGPAGAAGGNGAAGPQGNDGVQGPTGAAGPLGPTGPAGPSGSNGAAGATGATGATGPQGPVGPAGGNGGTGLTEVVELLTDAPTISVDGSLGRVMDVTLGGNRTMANPTNLANGADYLYRVRQDATGDRTLTWGSSYLFGRTSTPRLAVVGNGMDVFLFHSDGASLYFLASYDAQGWSFTTPTVNGTLYVVSPSGNDSTGTGTLASPFATLTKAVTVAASGAYIRVLAGTYRLTPQGTPDGYGSSCIYDQGKNLTIFGANASTILQCYGSDSVTRDAHVMYLGAGTQLSNVDIQFSPNRSTNYENAITGWVSGVVRNVYFENISGTVSWSYSYNATTNFINCAFNSHNLVTSDYSGTPNYVNTLWDSVATLGTSSYAVLLDPVVAADLSNATAPAVLEHTGSPTIFNPDGSLSNVGVAGGTYGWP